MASSTWCSRNQPDQRDEDFHAAITEDLGEWAWTTKPVVETVKIVGTKDGRGKEIHEVLDRLGVPSGLHQARLERREDDQWPNR